MANNGLEVQSKIIAAHRRIQLGLSRAKAQRREDFGPSLTWHFFASLRLCAIHESSSVAGGMALADSREPRGARSASCAAWFRPIGRYHATLRIPFGMLYGKRTRMAGAQEVFHARNQFNEKLHDGCGHGGGRGLDQSPWCTGRPALPARHP